NRLAFVIATVIGVVGAVTQHLWLDPVLKTRMPEDFPADFNQWLTIVLFTLSFADLFTVFAPFDWMLRLSRSKSWATGLTIIFGLFVLWLRHRTLEPRLPASILAHLPFSRAL